MHTSGLEALNDAARGPRPALSIGTQTKWGKIIAVGNLCGERYYWLENQMLIISMVPAHLLENR